MRALDVRHRCGIAVAVLVGGLLVAPVSASATTTANPGPTVTSPVAGATVGGEISVEVSVPPSLQADRVQAQLVGRGGTVSAAVSGGVATLELPAWGSAGARMIRVLACRQAICSPTGTDVPVTVAYAAPTVTSPTDGSAFTTPHWTAQATAAAPVVKFLGDGVTPLGVTESAELLVGVPISSLSNGSHVITAVSCSADRKLCDTTPASAGVTITVTHLVPTVTSVSRKAISPNGDKVADNATLHFTVDKASDVHIYVFGPAPDNNQFHVVHLGHLDPGPHTWVWSGKNGPFVAKEGTYTLQVHEFDGTLTGTADGTVQVDLRGPDVTSARSTYSYIYPHHDGYRDSTTFSAHVAEQSTTVKVTVRHRFGAVVWTGTMSRVGDSFHVVWRGTTTSGKALPSGQYTWELRAYDSIGNGAGADYDDLIQLSTRRAVTKTFTKTLTALDVAGGEYQVSGKGGTVAVYKGFGKGALRYSAKASGAVRTIDYAPLLPHATQYKSVSVSLYGRGVHGGRAYLAFLDPNDAEVAGVTLSSAVGIHKGTSVSAATIIEPRSRGFRWELVVGDGDVYDVRTFTVRVHYFALVAA